MRKRNRTLYLFLILIMLVNIVSAETIIYDNITTSNYKVIKIGVDNLNIQNINEYSYEVYLNGTLLGYYKKGENVFIPDTSNISIWIPTPIKTNIDDSYNTIVKPVMITVLGFIFTYGLFFLITLLILYKIWKDFKKR